MDTLTITSLIVGCGILLVCILAAKNTRTRTSNRPNINIDFDMAKEHEDKNRYFS